MLNKLLRLRYLKLKNKNRRKSVAVKRQNNVCLRFIESDLEMRTEKESSSRPVQA